MKKIIWFLTFIWFLVISNLQLVHALESEDMHSSNIQMTKQNDESIFCDIWNRTESQCIKELLPDKLFRNEEKSDISIKIINNFCFENEPFFSLYKNIPNNIINSPPIPIFNKSIYSNLNWIIKNLN